MRGVTTTTTTTTITTLGGSHADKQSPHIALYIPNTRSHTCSFSPPLHINDFHLTQKILLEPFGSSAAGPKCTNTPFYFHSGALNITQDSKSTMMFYPHICCSFLCCVLFWVFFFGVGGLFAVVTLLLASRLRPPQASGAPVPTVAVGVALRVLLNNRVP